MFPYAASIIRKGKLSHKSQMGEEGYALTTLRHRYKIIKYSCIHGLMDANLMMKEDSYANKNVSS